MFIVNEKDFSYRFLDSGPKYLIRGPRLSFGVVVLKPNEDFQNHKHDVMEENFFILEGTIKFLVNGNEIIAKKGDFVHIEPTESHYLKNIGTTNAKATFCLGPYKEIDKIDLPL
ncbi:MAG: cupin domain-containing protein [Sarcina sp.]